MCVCIWTDSYTHKIGEIIIIQMISWLERTVVSQ